MSADNYYLIDHNGEKYGARMGFLSDDGWIKFDPDDFRFDTYLDVVQYVDDNYSEYGARMTDPAKNAERKEWLKKEFGVD